jgi:flagellar biosynthesis chaperone FliJ
MGRVNALNTPYTPPDLGGLTDYLKSYFQKLQGPAYTPQQLDLLQTQSLDPLSRERDAASQRVLEQASARGLDPKSGIVQKQLSDLGNKFEQIRTQTQAGFASKAVDLDRINAQQAASVGQLLNNIEQTNFNQNEQRANQALGYAQQVPDLARQRLLDAQGILSQNSVNPTSLLQLSQQGNQFDTQNTQNYVMGIASLIPYLLKIFGAGG